MNILIFGANWYNRGDESAIRAMIDEFRIRVPECKFKIQFNQKVDSIPYDDIEILKPFVRMDGKNKIKVLFYHAALRTNGRIPYIGRDSVEFKAFAEAVKWADYAIYAPGGPCIGDLYNVRKVLLDMIELIEHNGVPFSLFAPSVGPFTLDQSRIKSILAKANIICFRESISQQYFSSILPNKHTTVTLDSAFQHPIDVDFNKKKLEEYHDLVTFLNKYEKIIGITITDLKWHNKYKNGNIAEKIKMVFNAFVPLLESQGYGVLFIPQLFGTGNDKEYMSGYMGKHGFVMSDEYDCYFQQYVISKLYAVVGMRYHSNIFSAKMGTPFVSITYEQKMKGFMEKAGLEEYCIDVNSLSIEILTSKFDKMVESYLTYKELLAKKSLEFLSESRMTADLIINDMSTRGLLGHDMEARH